MPEACPAGKPTRGEVGGVELLQAVAHLLRHLPLPLQLVLALGQLLLELALPQAQRLVGGLQVGQLVQLGRALSLQGRLLGGQLGLQLCLLLANILACRAQHSPAGGVSRQADDHSCLQGTCTAGRAASEQREQAGLRTARGVGAVEGLQAAAHLLRHLALLLQGLLLERQLLLEGALQG